MSKVEDGYYFECEPVEERGNKTKIKEVIELRYPNLNLKVSKDTKNAYLGAFFVTLFIFLIYAYYIAQQSNNKIFQALIAFLIVVCGIFIVILFVDSDF